MDGLRSCGSRWNRFAATRIVAVAHRASLIRDPPTLRYADRLLAAQVRARDAAALLRRSFGVAGGDDLAAEAAGAGAEIEQAVGIGNHFAIVLDDDERVAQVAKLFERGNEPGVVARVEADRRLVEHVQHAAQAAADLAGEADALGFAAGKRRGGAAECEIVESDVDQEREPVFDFANQLAGDFLFVRREPPFFDLGDQLAQRRAADLVERAVAEADGRRIVAQPAAAAFAAVDLADELFEQRAQSRRELAMLLRARGKGLCIGSGKRSNAIRSGEPARRG